MAFGSASWAPPGRPSSLISTFGVRMAISTSWPGSVMCFGSLLCPYSTAGTRPSRLTWRAGPLPNLVRGSAVILTSGTVPLLELTEKSLLILPCAAASLAIAPGRLRPFRRRGSGRPRSPWISVLILGLLTLAVEQARDRAVAEDLVDRPRDQRRDRQHGELVEPLVVRDRQRVRHDHLADPRILEHVHGAAGEYAVRSGHDHLLGALLEQCLRRLHDRLAGVDHVVDDDAGLAFHLADDLEHPCLVRHVGVPPLVNDRQRAAEPVRPPLADPDSSGVRGDDCHPRQVELALQVGREDRQREQVVDRAVEEPLDL